MDYTKNMSGNKMLKARLTSVVERKKTGVTNAKIYIYAQIDITDSLLGKTITVDNRAAILHISVNERLKNLNDNFSFKAKFNGNDTLTSIETELIIIDIQIIISFFEVDSIKRVTAEAYEIIDSIDILPLEEIDIY